MRLDRAFAAVAILALLWIAGCGGSGPELGRVTGTIKLGGQPLEGATVEFQPETSGSPSYATTDAEGYYELAYLPGQPGALLGKHRVSISTFRQQSNPDGTTTTLPERLPAKYNAETELVREVQSGKNAIDFEL